MMQTLHVTLPVPPYELSKNGRVDRWKYNRIYQQHKQVGISKIREAMPDGDECWNCPVYVHVIWYKPSRRKLDFTNAVHRLDSYLDSSQAAGLIVDDAQIRGIQIEFFVDKANPRVEMAFQCDRSQP